jgi:hypothetical protein
MVCVGVTSDEPITAVLPTRAFEFCQNLGCSANLQDRIGNDVDVRSIAGSVVL